MSVSGVGVSVSVLFGITDEGEILVGAVKGNRVICRTYMLFCNAPFETKIPKLSKKSRQIKIGKQIDAAPLGVLLVFLIYYNCV